MLKFKFKRFRQLEPTELVTVPDFRMFSDGNDPFIRNNTLIQIKQDEFARVDIVADGDSLTCYKKGIPQCSIGGPEGHIIYSMMLMDKCEIVPYSLLTSLGFLP